MRLTNNMRTISEAAKVAERCQRNWDYDNPPSEEDIKTIVDVVTSMATKQNVEFYKLVVSTDRVFNRACYDVAYDEDPKGNPDFVNEDGSLKDYNDPKKWHRNGQVNAPLLLIFLENSIADLRDTYKDEAFIWTSDPIYQMNETEELKQAIHDKIEEEVSAQSTISIGIAAGAATLTAASLGYSTGFCSCLSWEKLRELLETKDISSVPDSNFHGALFVGIGMPGELPRTHVVVDDQHVYTAEIHNKSIPVTRIE